MSVESLTQKSPGLLDVLIVGGGLSGLMVAHELQQHSSRLSWRLLEARSVLGGRLANSGELDMGGAWIWLFQQAHMKRLTAKLGIPVFSQPDDPMSTRIDGGAVLYIHRLGESLDAVQLNAAVKSCTLTTNEDPVVCVETTSNEIFLARRVVFAVPPRLIAKHITFDPPLSAAKQLAMNASHTWMAGVTKVALLYESRFWDTHSSNLGFSDSPAFQVYDSSTKDASVPALTFFTLANTDDDKTLADQCATQIQNVWSYYRKPFADQSLNYVDYHVKRWPKEIYISEDPNPSVIHPHPKPNLELSTNEWNGALLFAGSESDVSSPGVMEGAVSAALRVIKDLQEYFSSSKSS